MACAFGAASAEAQYTVPADNPFVNTPGARGEIWAYGLRNPWRFSFDRATGDLTISDVYAALGDGGGGGDPIGNGQNLGTLLGKLIRIDP